MLVQFPAKAADKYTTFTVDAFKNAQRSGKILVVNSYEPWCWSCRKQDKVLEQAKQEFKNVVFLTYQQGKNKKIAEMLKINFRSTIVIYKGNDEIERLIGQTDKKTIFESIKKFI